MTDACTLGFRVVGSAAGERRIVGAPRAFAAYAACDPLAELHRESFLSAFTFGPDLRSRTSAGGIVDVRGFDGPCFAEWLWVDIDRPDMATALADARRFVGVTLERYRQLDFHELPVWFSGGKGSHVGLPVAAFRAAPSRRFNRTARAVCEALAASAGVVIDTTVYDKVRLFRAPNSRHPKTGLHKRHLSHDELMRLTPDRVLQLARTPAPFDVPRVTADCPQAADDWATADSATAARDAARPAPAEGAALQRATLELIHGTATPEQRELTVFRAAANLTEAGVPPAVVAELLLTPGRDCGLTPRELKHAIETGIRHANERRAK